MFHKNPEKVNIDELYEHHRRKSEKRRAMYNTILSQIHARIKRANKTTRDMDIVYKVPMIVFGDAVYNYQECVDYVVQQLTDNGFTVETQRNLIFISWKNWIPTFIRTDLKKKGIYVDALGNKLPDPTAELPDTKPPESAPAAPTHSRYKPIQSYRPTRSVIYDEALLQQTEQRLQKKHA
jgi:hypothetical protein